jgi:Lrp/AsnC family leucine-responsive transcriptional regulator
MDEHDRKITDLLAADARRSLADIGSVVGLSPSAVNDRIRRLTATGALRRFTVEADPDALGVPVLVFVWVALGDGADEAGFHRFARQHPAIIECHHVTGGWSYLIKLRVAAICRIEDFLAELKAGGFLGRSETVLALSSPVPGPFVPAGEG